MKLSIIIPVYNEELTIREILRRVQVATKGWEAEIIVVDDGSNDSTREILRQVSEVENIKLVFKPSNEGKGAAVRTGIAQSSGEIVLIQDADLEYDPKDYPALLEPILDGRADAVYGSRFTGTSRRVSSFWHTVGNRLITLLSNFATNLNLTDMETGYKAFRGQIIRALPLRSNRFGIEPEITAKLAKILARIYEVPISYSRRDYVHGKKITWKDGFAALYTIIKYALIDDLIDAETDRVGELTLRNIQKMGRYNRWLFDQTAPYLGRSILEVGSGTGNITQFLLDRERVIISDIDPTFLTQHRIRFGSFGGVEVRELNLEKSWTLEPPVESVLCMNVLEHLSDDESALRYMAAAVVPGGRVILLVPAFQNLFGTLDSALQHKRRYHLKDIEAIFERVGLRMVVARYLNALGAIGWYVNGRWLKRSAISAKQARLFNYLVPYLRWEARRNFGFGLSLLAVGEKPATG